LEERRLLNGDYRAIDGAGNNLAHPDWGMAGVHLLRIAEPDYGDGFSTLAGQDRRSPREISNGVSMQAPVTKTNDRLLSDFAYIFGQFISHDIDFTESNPFEPSPISVPCGDPYFDPHGNCTRQIAFYRSEYDAATGTDASNPRQQANRITAWLDGSAIYGSDAVRAAALRKFQGGRLKTSPGNLLPLNTEGLPNQNHGRLPGDRLFLAGDERANENVELTALHTLFLREHNWWADKIAAENPALDDETIYQMARQIVGAELQVITYNEFLPALLGPGVLSPYSGYQPEVNGGIATEFSTVGFRLGHSMLRENVRFLGNDGRPVAADMGLASAFFNPPVIQQHGIESLLKYLATDNANELDVRLIDAVRNFLFGPPGAGGFDLASLNIQRGRDHGIADYNALREAYGLERVFGWNQINGNYSLQSKLRSLYNFNIDNIDAWVGALAESHVPGASVGPLIQRIIADQFERLRDGDRYWYQLTFSPHEAELLEQTTLADIIRRNTGLSNIQDNMFFYEVAINGYAFNDRNGNKRRDAGEQPLADWVVQLRNKQGELLATARTDAWGFYQFDNHVPYGDDSSYGDPEGHSTLAIGDYQVRLVRPGGWFQTTANPPAIDISRGMVVGDVNFGAAALRVRPVIGMILVPASAHNWSAEPAPPTVPPTPEPAPPAPGPSSPPRRRVIKRLQQPAETADTGLASDLQHPT
jgi:hypothetical protein